MSGEADAMVSNTPLREVVGANLGRTVAGGDEALAAGGDVVDILLVLAVVDERVEARECTLLVLRLVACLSTLDENLLALTRVGILPHIAQTNTRFHLVHVLTTGTR